MLKKMTLIAACFFALTACAPAAFFAGAGVGTVIFDQRDMDTITQDHKTSHAISKKIHQDETLRKQTHISVTTFNHIVLLVGQAPTEALSARAYEIAQASSKVKRIYNEIKIAAPSSAMTRSSDTWITTKTKSRMLATKGLHSSQIKVITEDGTVYLMGIVNHKQGDLAAEVARRIDGVQKVVKFFEYIR